MIKLPLTFHLTSEDPPYLHGNTTLTNSPRSVLLRMHTSSASHHEPQPSSRSLPGYHARELQGDHPETADVNSEPSVFIRILLALVNNKHPG